MKIKLIGIGFLSVVLFGGPVFGEENTQYAGKMAMPLAREGGTARAMSMGSAVVGVPMGSASLFWNPAGLGRLENCRELGLHHNSGLGDYTHETAVYGVPTKSLGGFAGSMTYVNNGTFEGRDAAGNKTGDYTAGDFGVGLGWGKQWAPGLCAGAAVKYNRQTLDTKAYSAYAANVGLLWNALSRLNLGVTYSNLGTLVAGRLLDSGWRMGGSYGLSENLLLAVATELKPGGLNRLQMAVESSSAIAAFRLGYVHDFRDSELDGLTGLTAGLGVQLGKNIVFDYGYLPYGDLGTSHRLSLTYKFSCPEKVSQSRSETRSASRREPVESKYVEVPPEAEVKSAPVVEPNVFILEKLIVLEDTHFQFDTAILTAEGARIVTQNAQVLRENPEVRIRIAGYTSASGTAEYNQLLSERRAKAVEDLLVNEGGIAPERLLTIGYGKTRPAMIEPIPSHIDSIEARANMRVLFEIIVK